MGITRIGLKRPISVLMVILAILIFGIFSFRGFSTEMIPEVEMPILIVRTDFEGADPETIDEMVSRNIEEMAETLNGIDSIQCYSYENYSMVMLRYQYGTDLMSNYLKLQNALAETKRSFPDGVGEPVIIEMNMDTQPSMKISAWAEDQTEVLLYLNEGMLSELENLPSVAQVDVFGGEIPYIRVEVKPELLRQYGLNLQEVSDYMASANFSVPIGTVQQGNQNLDVVSSAKSTSLDEICDIPLQSANGGMLRLEDLADISWAVKNADSISHFNGEENVTISITKSQRATAYELSKQVGEVIKKYETTKSGVEFEVFYDGGEEIISSVKAAGIALLIGLILALLLVWGYFGDVKAVLTIGGSVILSMLMILMGMSLLGFSLNVITIGALIIALGLLLDTAIVVLETCFKISTGTKDRQETVLEAAKVLKNSIILFAITIIVVCVPLAFLKGISARMFVPLGGIIILAAVASFIEGMVLVPLLYVFFKPEEKRNVKFAEKLDKFTDLYEKAVRKLMSKRDIVIAVAIFLLVISCAAVIFTKKEMVGETGTGVVNISVDFRSGMMISEVEEKLIVIEEFLDNTDEVESYSTTISESSAEIQVKLKNRSQRAGEKFCEKVKTETKHYVGINLEFSNVSNLAGLTLPEGEQVILSGYHLDELRETAAEVTERYRKIPGVLAVLSSAETEGTQLEIEIDPLSAMSYGLTSGQVAQTLKEVTTGAEVMVIEEEDRTYSVCLEYSKDLYSSPQSLMNANIPTPDGGSINLSEIASLEYTDAQECIERRDGKYVVTLTVTCPEKYRDDVRSEMDKAWSKVRPTADISKEMSTVEEMRQEEFGSLYCAIAAAFFLIFLVLTIRYESLKYALTMMLGIPLGLFGAFVLMFISGNAWSMVSLMGILLLTGMIVFSSIRYTEYIGMLEKEMPFEEALVEGGKKMLLPLLLTVLTLIAVTLPLAVWPGSGAVIMRSMAVIVIGGMLGGTALILLVLPVFYQFLYGKEDEEEDVEESAEIQVETIEIENE